MGQGLKAAAHSLCADRKQDILNLPFAFIHFVKTRTQPMGWGPSHQGGPSFLSQTSVETPAETHPEVCRLLDSKSSCRSRLSITAF